MYFFEALWKTFPMTFIIQTHALFWNCFNRPKSTVYQIMAMFEQKNDWVKRSVHFLRGPWLAVKFARNWEFFYYFCVDKQIGSQWGAKGVSTIHMRLPSATSLPVVTKRYCPANKWRGGSEPILLPLSYPLDFGKSVNRSQSMKSVFFQCTTVLQCKSYWTMTCFSSGKSFGYKVHHKL